MSNSCFAPKAILAAGLIACFALPAHAQFRLIDPDEKKVWQESTPVQPPSLSGKTPIPVEGLPGSQLSFGIDPESIAIVDDHQAVRYAVIIQSPSARTVVYEGIRCSTSEKRVYARQNGDTATWTLVDEGWNKLSQTPSSRYALNLIRDGLCLGSTTNRTVKDIIRDLNSNHGANQLYR